MNFAPNMVENELRVSTNVKKTIADFYPHLIQRNPDRSMMVSRPIDLSTGQPAITPKGERSGLAQVINFALPGMKNTALPAAKEAVDALMVQTFAQMGSDDMPQGEKIDLLKDALIRMSNTDSAELYRPLVNRFAQLPPGFLSDFIYAISNDQTALSVAARLSEMSKAAGQLSTLTTEEKVGVARIYEEARLHQVMIGSMEPMKLREWIDENRKDPSRRAIAEECVNVFRSWKKQPEGPYATVPDITAVTSASTSAPLPPAPAGRRNYLDFSEKKASALPPEIGAWSVLPYDIKGGVFVLDKDNRAFDRPKINLIDCSTNNFTHASIPESIKNLAHGVDALELTFSNNKMTEISPHLLALGQEFHKLKKDAGGCKIYLDNNTGPDGKVGITPQMIKDATKNRLGMSKKDMPDITHKPKVQEPEKKTSIFKRRSRG